MESFCLWLCFILKPLVTDRNYKQKLEKKKKRRETKKINYSLKVKTSYINSKK